MTFHVPNAFRIREGELASPDAYENNGAFILPLPDALHEVVAIIARPLVRLLCIASDGAGWEHVSVSFPDALGRITPRWEHMAHVRATFWDPDDLVVQFHPPRCDYVNYHAGTLHLWRPTIANRSHKATWCPTPPPYLVGPWDPRKAR